MTSIFLTVTGARAQASVTGALTSGMVGLPVTIEYDAAWEGLTKNLVCRCDLNGAAGGEYRSVLNIGGTAAVAQEVMQAGAHLYLGVEGFSPDGKLVIPTTWALCGVIERGANTAEDLSADPTLPVWSQLQAQIDQLDPGGISQEQLDEIRACADSAARAAQAAAISAGRAEEAAGGGLNGDAKEALMAVVEHIAVWDHPNPQELIDNLRNALYNAPVASISAVYTQTRTVYASDSLDVLRADLVVTAVYTDGSSAVSTAYALSGTLTSGLSTITATLDGKTAQFQVQVAAARVPATGITLDNAALNITSDEPVRLTATVEPANSTDNVVWESTEDAVATVAQDGTVTPVASGSCRIIATAGDVSAECTVTVALPLTGWNYGNPYDLRIADDPLTLGKTDEELTGRFYRCSYNEWSKAMNDGSYASYNYIFLWPMTAGKYYLRTVNRSSAPMNRFMVFGNGDIVANTTKPLVILSETGTDETTGVTLTVRSAFDWIDANGFARSGIVRLGQPLDEPTGISYDGPAVILYEIDVPEGVYVFWQAYMAESEWPRTNDWYPIDELYTIFRDDPSGNILQIAREDNA